MGYTKNVINKCLWDVEDELKVYLSNGGTIGSAKHIELSNRLKTISTLACTASLRKTDNLI